MQKNSVQEKNRIGNLVEESVSEQILALGKETAEIAKNVTNNLEKKLNPVLLSEFPTDSGCDLAMPSVPPLFEEFRSLIMDIRNQLYKIEDLTKRTAL